MPSDPSRDLDLLAGMRRRAEALMADRGLRNLENLVAGVVRTALEAIPGTDGVSITRTGPRPAPPGHASDEDIAALDAVQRDSGMGPCVEAADRPPGCGVVVATDLAEEPDHGRWPGFAERAVAAGYRSVLSLQLGVDERRRSSLNFYARRHHAFGPDAQWTAGLFGVQAALLLHGADHAADLQRALASRDLIGQAKGILVERFGVNGDRAFAMLVESSQNTNMKLVDVARWLVDDTVAGHEEHLRPSAS